MTIPGVEKLTSPSAVTYQRERDTQDYKVDGNASGRTTTNTYQPGNYSQERAELTN